MQEEAALKLIVLQADPRGLGKGCSGDSFVFGSFGRACFGLLLGCTEVLKEVQVFRSCNTLETAAWHLLCVARARTEMPGPDVQRLFNT